MHHCHHEQIKMYLLFVSPKHAEMCPRVRDCAAKSQSCTVRLCLLKGLVQQGERWQNTMIFLILCEEIRITLL